MSEEEQAHITYLTNMAESVKLSSGIAKYREFWHTVIRGTAINGHDPMWNAKVATNYALCELELI